MAAPSVSTAGDAYANAYAAYQQKRYYGSDISVPCEELGSAQYRTPGNLGQCMIDMSKMTKSWGVDNPEWH